MQYSLDDQELMVAELTEQIIQRIRENRYQKRLTPSDLVLRNSDIFLIDGIRCNADCFFYVLVACSTTREREEDF